LDCGSCKNHGEKQNIISSIFLSSTFSLDYLIFSQIIFLRENSKMEAPAGLLIKVFSAGCNNSYFVVLLKKEPINNP
jgi:hypothetical protein